MMDDEDEIDVDGTLHGSATTPSHGHFGNPGSSAGIGGGNGGHWRKESHIGTPSSTSTVPQINDTFTRGQVDIIDMRKQPDNAFTYIFK